MKDEILLSICIPTYNRVPLLKRTLESVKTVDPRVEIIVTDNSPGDESKLLVENFYKENGISGTYHKNNFPDTFAPHEYLVNNFNQGIKLSRGKFVYIIHDDDYLFEGVIEIILKKLELYGNEYAAFKFGVTLVSMNETKIKDQTVKTDRYLDPADALVQFFQNSSYIRFPSMIYNKKSLESIGLFDVEYKYSMDYELFVRVLAEYGLFEVSNIVAAYTIHEGAATMKSFNSENLNDLNNIFKIAESKNLIPSNEMLNLKSLFFHQYILAGTYRMMKINCFNEADRVFNLFKEIKLKFSIKWMPLRVLFALILKIRLMFKSAFTGTRT